MRLFFVCQIYDEYGWEGLETFEANEVAKQTLGVNLEHPKEVRCTRGVCTWFALLALLCLLCFVCFVCFVCFACTFAP